MTWCVYGMAEIGKQSFLLLLAKSKVGIQLYIWIAASFPVCFDKVHLTFNFCQYRFLIARMKRLILPNPSFFPRMGGCVGSALLSSLIAWSSANRMAAMGESLLSNGVCPKNCCSFGFEQDYLSRRFRQGTLHAPINYHGYGHLNLAHMLLPAKVEAFRLHY